MLKIMLKSLTLLLAAVPLLGQAEIVDPTQPISYAGSATGSTKTAAGDLRLESILFSDNRRIAIINGSVVGVGEKIGGVKVKSIDAEKVTISRAGKREVLKLPTAQVKRKSDNKQD